MSSLTDAEQYLRLAESFLHQAKNTKSPSAVITVLENNVRKAQNDLRALRKQK